MTDIYLGDILLVNDGDAAYISADHRLYVDGSDLEMQSRATGSWVAMQTWESGYDGAWRVHVDAGIAYVQEKNGSAWVTAQEWSE